MNKNFRNTVFLLSSLFFIFLYLPVENIPQRRILQPPSLMAAEYGGAAWRDEWNNTVAAAKKEGSVVVYSASSGSAIRKALVPKVKELFGIVLEVVSGPSDELTQKILTERQRGLFLVDAFIAGTPLVGKDYVGLLSPLEKALILPEATDTKAWPNGQLPFIDKNKQTIPLTGAYWSYIMVNTSMLKEGELKSYADLVQPKWKGKMIMFDPASGGAASNWVTYVMRIMGPEKGEKFLRQLANQDLMLTRDARLQAEWLARGKYPLAIAPSMGAVTPLRKAGAPIAWVRMNEGGLVHPSGSIFGLVNKAPHPHAAKVLFNWLLTGEGQYIFSHAFGQPATRLGVSTEGIDPFTVPKIGEKVFRIDEMFIIEVETKGRVWGKKYFGHLLQ